MRTAALFRRRPRWVIAGWIVLIVACALLFDYALDAWVVAHRTAGWELAGKMVSRYFAWHWLMVLAALGLLLAWWRRREDWRRVLLVMMLAASLAGLSADVLRAVIGRTRPSAKVAQGWYGVRANSEWLIIQHQYNSFPSGHTSAAAGFVLPLFFWRRRTGGLVFGFVALVAGARVLVGAHHLSDVLAGALLGSLIAGWCWRRFDCGERLVRALPGWRQARG